MQEDIGQRCCPSWTLNLYCDTSGNPRSHFQMLTQAGHPRTCMLFCKYCLDCQGAVPNLKSLQYIIHMLFCSHQSGSQYLVCQFGSACGVHVGKHTPMCVHVPVEQYVCSTLIDCPQSCVFATSSQAELHIFIIEHGWRNLCCTVIHKYFRNCSVRGALLVCTFIHLAVRSRHQELHDMFRRACGTRLL